ncbi:MAG: TolC family protein [Saprospiraceae bacterium]|uniref:TolC family protein n=1 Tax=Candidatus Defluviibacterium haderslevense TaxID=2981993 RepID=A0A9D7XEM7_9BACT|nr:TolC family protein [Candidatus Defluviibacterium haderslevense]MBL0237520.1 TolC family protein [Candidatus Defluviibacterium haderslevense]
MKSKLNKIEHNIGIFMILIMLLPNLNVHAQRIITLPQAIQNGIANKKNIIAGKLDANISNLQTQAMYRKYWPQVSADYTYVYNPILQTSILPIGIFNPSYPIDATKSVQFGTKWTQSAGLTALQPLINVSIQKQIHEAKLKERIAVLSQEQTEYELAYNIAQTYIDIYLQEAKIKSCIADTGRTYVSYKLLKNKFDEKRLLKSDLNTAKVNHNNTVQSLSDGISQLIEDKVYLLFLMGTTDMDKWDFEIDTLFTTNYSISPKVMPIQIDQLPEMQQLTLQSQLTHLQVNSEKSKHIPTVNFKGYLGANQYTNVFNPLAANSWFGLSYLGLDVMVPLLFGENLKNKTQQLKLQSKQYELQKENKTLQYTKELITANLQIENIKTQLVTQKENISLISETIAIFQARVEEGQESISNLNFEETNLQALEAKYETSKKQLWAHWLDYLKASGQLSILWK